MRNNVRGACGCAYRGNRGTGGSSQCSTCGNKSCCGRCVNIPGWGGYCVRNRRLRGGTEEPEFMKIGMEEAEMEAEVMDTEEIDMEAEVDE